MEKRRAASHKQSSASVVSGGAGFAAKPRGWPIGAIAMTVVLLAYVAATRFLFGPAQPLIAQQLLGLGCALLAVPPFLLFTRHRSATKLDRLRAQLAQRTGFGKELLAAHPNHRRKVKLPLIGETSVRSLGGIAVFAVVFAWWWTPLAPVRVKLRVIDNLTVPLGDEIVAVVMVVPNGRIAIVTPPAVPARAEELGRLIKENASAYERGLKAIAAGRYDNARILLDAAAQEGLADALQIQLAKAQNDVYAGQFANAAKTFEDLVRQKPDNVMYLLQAAVAWLQAGRTASAEPLAARAMKLCSEKPTGKDRERDREEAFCLHVQAVLQVARGKQFLEAAESCARTRDLLQAPVGEKMTEGDANFRAASWNNEAVLCLLAGKYPGAVNRFDAAQHAWTPRHPLLAATSDNQAVLYVMLDKYREADEALSRAEGIVRGLLPREQPLVAYTAICRAVLQEARGQYWVALPPAQEASAIVEKALGAAHPANVPILDVLTLLYAGRARYYKAEACSHKGRELSQRIWGLQHPFFAQMLSRHAELSVLDQHYSEAEASCRQALEIFQRSLGKECFEAATVMNTWGWLEIERGKPGDARPYLEKALKIREDTFGREHLDVACTLGHLAALENSPETFRQGEEYYKLSINISEKVLGLEHPDVARLLCARRCCSSKRSNSRRRRRAWTAPWPFRRRRCTRRTPIWRRRWKSTLPCSGRVLRPTSLAPTRWRRGPSRSARDRPKTTARKSETSDHPPAAFSLCFFSPRFISHLARSKSP